MTLQLLTILGPLNYEIDFAIGDFGDTEETVTLLRTAIERRLDSPSGWGRQLADLCARGVCHTTGSENDGDLWARYWVNIYSTVYAPHPRSDHTISFAVEVRRIK